MPNTDSEQWRLFYAITPQQISAEIADAEADFPAFMRREKASVDVRRTPAGQAQENHEFLIMASVYSRLEHVLPESRVHMAYVIVMRVADNAQDIAFEQGRHKAISAAMDAIKQRENLAEGEDWMLGEGPEDYRALSRESEKLFDRVAETIVPEVLRRYHMEPLADLYEQDRRRFAIEAEIGLRIERPEEPSDETVDGWNRYFAKEYGPDALIEVQRRTAEIRRREGRP